VVYPFVKIRAWYALSADERQRAMDEHIMTAFECDEPADFMHLMLTLRESEASRYTERDTPIFVGVAVDIRTAVGALDGAVARIAAEAS